MRSSKGFTLIELLVVISIISLLSSIITPSLNSARSKATNASKRHIMEQYRIAFELHHTINNHYPSPSAWEFGTFNCLGNDNVTCGYFDEFGMGLFNMTGIPDAQLKSQITSVFPAAPSFDLIATDGIGNQFKGPIYRCQQYNGTCMGPTCTNGVCAQVDLSWYETGDSSCIGGATKSYNGASTLCRLNLE